MIMQKLLFIPLFIVAFGCLAFFPGFAGPFDAFRQKKECSSDTVKNTGPVNRMVHLTGDHLTLHFTIYKYSLSLRPLLTV
jgi:hypothetical protein